MIDLKQKELAKWHLRNFGIKTKKSEWQFIGLVEEVGELAHAILKRKQSIRNISHESISDAFADIVIFGIQIMTCENRNVEDVLQRTISEVLQRDWKSIQ